MTHCISESTAWSEPFSNYDSGCQVFFFSHALTQGGWTALTYAAAYGKCDVVKELISLGADVDVKDNVSIAYVLSGTQNIKITFTMVKSYTMNATCQTNYICTFIWCQKDALIY